MVDRRTDGVEQAIEEGEANMAQSWLGYSWRLTTRMALGTWAGA